MPPRKPPAKKRPTPPSQGPAWQVILEEIRSQNRIAMEAVQSHHEEARIEIQNFRGEVHADMSMLRTLIQGHSIDIHDVKTGMARVDTKVDRIETRVGNLETRVGNLDTKVGELDTKVDRLGTKMGEVDAKVDRLETKVDKLAPLEERVAALERQG